MKIFERLESQVRSYCRSFPVVFEKGKDSYLFDSTGKKYIDFFCGAGTLNYGHNPEGMKQAVLDYLENDGVIHSLDMATTAKARFLETLESVILQPRGLNHKVQFVAPSGANAVEAALKLARLDKQRSNVVAFTNSYHGLTAGALAVTANKYYRNEAFVSRLDVSFMPYDGYLGEDIDTTVYLQKCIQESGSGLDLPAAVIVECIQAEGGINVARFEWLQSLAKLCRENDILLVVDDIQIGNGRTGTYFSFEMAGIEPDIIVLSKAIGGYGFPLSIVLLKPELDHWKPGEHTGTFRGDNLAFVAAAQALGNWGDDSFSESIRQKGQRLEAALQELTAQFPALNAKVRGRGMIYGLDIPEPEIARATARESFARGLILELCGEDDRVLKFLPALTIDDEVLGEGIEIIRQSMETVLQKRG